MRNVVLADDHPAVARRDPEAQVAAIEQARGEAPAERSGATPRHHEQVLAVAAGGQASEHAHPGAGRAGCHRARRPQVQVVDAHDLEAAAAEQLAQLRRRVLAEVAGAPER